MRPFVFVNLASSIDGKISNERREQLRISCDEDFRRVDELRASSDGIMVGIGTVLADNPSLTIKDPRLRSERVKSGRKENPIRIVVDSFCRTPPNSKVLDDSAETVIATTNLADPRKLKELSKKAKIIVSGERKVDLKLLLEKLYEMGIRRLMVEGGGTLISSLIAERLVDEMYIYYAPIFIGGKGSPTICDGSSYELPIRVKVESVDRLGEGILFKLKFKRFS